MNDKSILRQRVKEKLDESVEALNSVLRGDGLDALESILERVSSGQGLPHWYPKLKKEYAFPNLDGKSVGSVIEMLYLAVLETRILNDFNISHLTINPAKGVNFPDLDLGVKSPSTNYATSEPFFSAYERLLGSEYDCVVLVTNYQDVKKDTSLQLQIQKAKYLEKTQLADKHLCQIAKAKREWLLNDIGEPGAKKIFRFLAYVNQQDWRARHLLKLVEKMPSQQDIPNHIEQIKRHHEKTNKQRRKDNKELISKDELSCLIELGNISPVSLGIINAAEDWIIEIYQESARYPNNNEWQRLKSSPLNGEIGMSLALQWRYNFKVMFS